MIRVVLSKVPPSGRFQRFWVPSLDQIEKTVLAHGRDVSDAASDNVTELIRRVRVGATNKSTAPARLESADTALLSQLAHQPPGALQFLDIGCSDGTTSIDTIEKLTTTFRIPVHAHLMDRYIWVRRRRRFFLVEYVTSNDELVMVRCGLLAMCHSPRSFLLAPITNQLISLYLSFTTFRQRMHESTAFPLLSPRVLSRSDVDIIEGSVLSLNPIFLGKMDIVRVSNLLHYDYFSQSDIVTGLSNAAKYLRDGGFLLISRNHDINGKESERGTIWCRNGHSLVRSIDFGGGSELTDLVESSDLIGGNG